MKVELLFLDTRTVLLLLCLGNLASAGFLLLYAGKLRSLPDRLFILSKLLQGAAWFLSVLRGAVPDVLSFGLGNGFLLYGFWLESHCLRALDQSAGESRRLGRLFALSCALGVAATYLLPQPNLRITLCSAIAAGIFALAGLRLLRGRQELSPLRRAVGAAYLLIFCTSLIRAGIALVTPEATIFSPSLSLSLAHVPLFLLMIAGSFGLLLLFKEREDETLMRIATRDDLTGAPNRRALLELGTRLVARARREGRPLAVLMLDIDHFKQVNDTHGHAAGDAVLRDLARVIRESLRSYDVFGRFGGEEFVAVLPEASLEDARGVAERIRAAVQAGRPENAGSAGYTVSIGVAWGVPPHGGLVALLALADRAMYAAKRLGRNRVEAALAPADDDAPPHPEPQRRD